MAPATLAELANWSPAFAQAAPRQSVDHVFRTIFANLKQAPADTASGAGDIATMSDAAVLARF